jgi:hypothetical protein
MPKLNQIIAVEKSIKNECNNAITKAYHDIQKAEPFKGISRAYTPKEDGGETFPPENQKVQKNAVDLLNFTADTFTKYWDVTLTKDTANQGARADVVLDNKVLIKGAPVVYLLFLEKQLTDVATLVKTLPVLDPAETWHLDEHTSVYKTDVQKTNKMKKVMKAFTKAAATDKHPAQVDTFTEDVVQGVWDTVKHSGALPQKKISEILERVTKLQAAVKFAREEANTAAAPEQHVGSAVFGFLLGH